MDSRNKNNQTEKNNPDDRSEYESENTSDGEKSSGVIATVVTAQGKVDIYNNHFLIPVKTGNNNKTHGRLYTKRLVKTALRRVGDSLMSFFKCIRLTQ